MNFKECLSGPWVKEDAVVFWCRSASCKTVKQDTEVPICALSNHEKVVTFAFQRHLALCSSGMQELLQKGKQSCYPHMAKGVN